MVIAIIKQYLLKQPTIVTFWENEKKTFIYLITYKKKKNIM